MPLTRAIAVNQIGLFSAPTFDLWPMEETAKSFIISVLSNANEAKSFISFYKTGLNWHVPACVCVEWGLNCSVWKVAPRK